MNDYPRFATFNAGTSDERTVAFNAGAPTRTQSWAATLARWALTVVGIVFCGGLAVVSCYFNIRFARNFAETPAELTVWTAFAVCIDGIKVSAPIAWIALRERGQAMLANGALVLTMLAFTWSLFSGSAYILQTRDLKATQGNYASSEAREIKARIDRTQQQLDLVPRHEPLEMIRAAIGQEQARLGIDSYRNRCEDNDSWALRNCRKLRGLEADLAAAESGYQLEEKLRADWAELRRVTANRGTISDAQVTLIAEIGNVAQTTARTAIAIVLAVLIDVFATFGPAIMINGAKALSDTYDQPAPVQETPVEVLPPRHGSFAEGFSRWAMENIGEDVAGQISSRQAYTHFQHWARFNGPYEIPSRPEVFGKAFAAHCEAMGAVRTRSGAGGTLYKGITMTNKVRQLQLPAAAQ
jgi:hypothetical protein